MLCKESWQLYDYLGRWWRWLLLAAVIGALAGTGFHSIQDHLPGGFEATASILIENPVSRDRPPPPVSVNLSSETWPSEQTAVAALALSVGRIVDYSKAPVQVQNIELYPRLTGSLWWKTAALGSAISSLLVIGWSYIWEDCRAFVQHRRQMEAHL